MIDREARKTLAELLRHLAAAVISNDEFEARLPKTQDPAVHAIRQSAWLLYDDLHEHKLTGKYRLTAESRRDLSIAVLFLQTDLPYEWPSLPGWLELLIIPINVVSLGMIRVLYRRWFERQGDFDVWPFLRAEDFETSRKNPRYMAGAA